AWDDVRANLRAIAGLTDRIGAVTAQLRGFARKGSGAVRAVALGDVIAGARLMLKERLRAIDVRVTPIDPALAVMAGRIRLEQVLVNLLQN
ncbi:sensor histidine kinase, partial [Enterococcus faecium]